MTRHSRNCTSSAVYTYHEKKRDAQAGEYGSREVRIGRDSVKKFDCCCLTNQPCREPVVTPLGHLYEREAILQCMLQQRKDIQRRARNRERQAAAEAARESRERSERAHQAEVDKYLSANCVAATSTAADAAKQKSATAAGASSGDRLPNFWVPSAAPASSSSKSKSKQQGDAAAQDEVDDKVRCPMSRKPLRLKDLVEVRFKPAPGGGPGVSGYVCAITGDALNDSTPLCVIRPSGCVATKEAVDRLVRPDMRDPTTGRELTEADIIPLQRGASGFAGSGHSLLSRGAGVVMQVT